MFKKKSGFMAIIIGIALLFGFTACSDPFDGTNGGAGGTTGGGSQGGIDGVPGSFSAYVSTSLSDEYAYELAFESSSSSARAAVLAPKEDGFYSLIVYDVKDGKVRGVSEGKIKVNNGGLTLKPNDTNDPDITVTVSGGEMTHINGKTNKGGKHDLPGSVKPFRQTEGVSGDFRYATNPGNTVTITKYTGNGGAVTIPDKINGKTVIGIGTGAFFANNNITSVTIPDSVTNIGLEAFIHCESLTSINIPGSVNSIGRAAFTTCWSLTSITLPNSITSIGNGAFYSCYGLTSVNIPNSVTSIEDGAFGNCTSLASITIGSGVTSGVEEAFYGTHPSLITINVDSGNTAYSSQDGVLYNKNKTTLIIYPVGKITASFTIPNSVTTIGVDAFYGCTSLTSITIPNGVKSIGGAAFCGCTGLTSVTIPDSVISIEEDGYKLVDTGAFQKCTSLTSVTIGSGVTSIGDRAFKDCTSLTSITVAPGNNNYASEAGFFYKINGPIILILPSGKSGNVTIPNSVTSIVERAFYGCTSLTGITIPNSVISIGKLAFSGCTGLTGVTIPNSVRVIGVSAFSYCTSITSVTIPNSVIDIGSCAFDRTSLTSVTFETGSNISDSYNSYLSDYFYFGRGAFPEENYGGGPNNRLRTAYFAASPKAGTYTRAANGDTWTKIN